MAMKLKKQQDALTPQMAPTDGSGPAAFDAVRSDARNVLVSHGVHHGRFPVGGMVIREARRILQKLINIDPSAVAVVNGSPVDETTIISENISLLSFVKPSSLKG